MLKRKGNKDIESISEKTQRFNKQALVLLGVATVMVFALTLSACTSTESSGNHADADWNALIQSHPDDPFVASYASDSSGCLASTHKNLGYTCSDCHEDATAQLVGTLENAPDSSESAIGTREFCLSCHDWDKIVNSAVFDGEKTIYNPEGTYNVHNNHRGDVNCSECHSMHEASTLNCVECHYFGALPEGWDGYE